MTKSGKLYHKIHGMTDSHKLSDILYTIGTSHFVLKETLEDFEKCFMPPEFLKSPSTAVAIDPVRSAIYLIIKKHVRNTQRDLNDYDLQTQQGLREPVYLKIGGQEYQLDLKLLMVLADFLPNLQHYKQLASALLGVGHPMISAQLVQSDFFDTAQMDEAWNAGSVMLCRALLDNDAFFDQLTDDQARDIIAVEDIHMLQTVAHNINRYYRKRHNLEQRRLSEHMRDMLMECLLRQKDNDVIRLLKHKRKWIPGKFLGRLKKAL